MSVEILAPGGSADGIYAAMLHGADAVYTGTRRFSARAFADNPSVEELCDILDFAHARDKKIYVTKIDAENNRVVLDEEKYILSDTLIAENVNFQPIEFPKEEIYVQAKIRYAARPAEAVVMPLENGCVRVKFSEPQRAITKGQSVVFYDGNVLVGGGIIK